LFTIEGWSTLVCCAIVTTLLTVFNAVFSDGLIRFFLPITSVLFPTIDKKPVVEKYLNLKAHKFFCQGLTFATELLNLKFKKKEPAYLNCKTILSSLNRKS